MKAITPIYTGPFSFFNDLEREITGHAHSRSVRESALTSKQTDEAWLAALEMPGVSSEDLNIEFEDGSINLSGKKKGYFDSSEETTFTRSIRIPEEVDPEKIEAKLKDGVLLLTLPKLAKARPKKIQITTH